jgi:hypothetical protein
MYLPKPLTAIKTLVVQGNQAKRKNTKRTKIAPSPIGEMEAQVVRGTCVQGASVSAVFYFSNVRQKTIEPEFELSRVCIFKWASNWALRHQRCFVPVRMPSTDVREARQALLEATHL